MSSAEKRLRVCLVSAAYYPYPSGVSEHVHHLGLNLHRLGHDVELITTRFPGTATHQPPPFPVTRFGRAVLVPLNKSYATLPVGIRLPGQVRGYLHEREFDIVHCHGVFWPEISYWAIRHSRSVNVVSFLTAGFGNSRRGSRLFRSLFRGQLRRIHGLIAISNRAREVAEPYLPGDYRIIPCGVDLDRFRPGLPLPDGIEREGPTILFLGRLDRRKGVTVLLHAMPLVLESVPGARLLVAGKGPEEESARRLATDLGIERSVRFIGAVPNRDIPRCYPGADVYCSPALGGESLGIVLLEAMASGTPVVCSDIPGYDETVRRDRDGLLVPPGSPVDLARDLVRVLTEKQLRDRLVASGLERVKSYAWPEVTRRTAAYYRELLDSNRSA